MSKKPNPMRKLETELKFSLMTLSSSYNSSTYIRPVDGHPNIYLYVTINKVSDGFRYIDLNIAPLYDPLGQFDNIHSTYTINIGRSKSAKGSQKDFYNGAFQKIAHLFPEINNLANSVQKEIANSSNVSMRPELADYAADMLNKSNNIVLYIVSKFSMQKASSDTWTWEMFENIVANFENEVPDLKVDEEIGFNALAHWVRNKLYVYYGSRCILNGY